MKEYGSNIQKLVEHLQTIEDREKRTRYAHILVELMRQIHPNMRDNQDYYNKLWDDLYIMSGFTLDVDSPYPPPPVDVLGRKPQQVPYNTHDLRHKHYGHNIKLLVDKAVSLEDPEERRAFVSYLIRLMRTFYTTWNKDTVEDESLLQNLEDIANGRLHEEIKAIREGGFIESTPRERTADAPVRRNEGGQGNYRTNHPNQNYGRGEGGPSHGGPSHGGNRSFGGGPSHGGYQGNQNRNNQNRNRNQNNSGNPNNRRRR